MLTSLGKAFQKRSFVFLVLFLLLIVQLVYSFLFPSSGYSGTGHRWLSLPDLISHERSPLESKDSQFIEKLEPFFANFTVNADGGEYLVLAKNFPQYYFKNPIYLSRPLYSVLIAVVSFLPNLFFDSYAIFFVSAIFINFLLALAVVVLLYILIEKLISSRVALMSSALFIFSPLVHANIAQPIPEILGAFMIIASLYFIYDYIKKPSFLKLTIFSLIAGTFLLAKLFLAATFFILFLAIAFRRYKEGIMFFLIHLIPLGFWYIWVTQVFGLRFYENATESYGAGVWLFDIFSWHWPKIVETFLNVLPQFFSAIIYGFLLIPVIFAFFGYKKLLLAKKDIFCLGFLLAFLATFFTANFYFPRHAFLLFPMIYPLAVLGIDRTADFLKKYNKWYELFFYAVTFASIIAISSINIYPVFTY